MLFKAQPGGTILNELRKSAVLKPWMHVQTQDHGSYKSCDVVEALDWMLPWAADSSESIIVLLDWYSGHLTEEVEEIVRKKGHVLLFHGGGCTPFTQVNDTHLHATLARFLIQIENDYALHERQRLLDLGENKTPKLHRDTIISMVQSAWLCIDHAKVAKKGYKQTGPAMPMSGPVSTDDVCKDVYTAMIDIDGSGTPTEMGMTLRDDAIAFVKEGFATGKWTTWADAYKLIEEHDGREEALDEGLEAFGVDVYDEENQPEIPVREPLFSTAPAPLVTS